MKIEKILNNNVVVILDESGTECIIMGKGIAFNKKNGDLINDENVDKIFSLKNKAANDQFQELVVDIPLDQILCVQEIIKIIKEESNKNVGEVMLITLLDHIHTAIVRIGQDIRIINPMLWDIKRFYPSEYKMGLKALDIIEKNFNVRLSDDEAGFIAIHIANAQINENSNEIQLIYKVTKIMQEITNIVKYHFNVNFNEDSVYFHRFTSHLNFFAQRLSKGTKLDDDSDGLLDVIKIKYKNSYECVEKIASFIESKYRYIISDDEKLYLTIHIERVIYKTCD